MEKSSIIFSIIIILLCIPLIALIGITLKQDQITPNDEFFTISISGTPSIDIDTWELKIDGLVETPLVLSYQNITALPSKSVTAKLKCVEGPSGTAVWKGVKLKTVLDLAVPKPNAEEVIFYAADDYSSSLELDDATADDVLLAYEMNGETLPADHGYPLRLVVPGKAGYKWVKWLERIEVVDYDYKGYWESRGWDDDADLAAVSDWGTHAFILSIGFIFGGLAILSGFRCRAKNQINSKLPEFLNRKLHRYTSMIYLVILFIIYIYWAYTTYLLRGNIFYSGHGQLSLVVIAVNIIGGISGMKHICKYKVGASIHRNASLFGFILYAGVIAMGLVLAY